MALLKGLFSLIQAATSVTPFGRKPPVRIGRAPKRLLLVSGGGIELRKHRTPQFLDANGTAHMVEVLANGQQFVASGIHPKTGKTYVWMDGISPLNVSPEDRPRLTVDQLRELLTFSVAEFKQKKVGRPRKPTEARPEAVSDKAVVRPGTDLTGR